MRSITLPAGNRRKVEILSLGVVGDGHLITQPTVFVIGAGASQPYGLPLGGELKRNILNRYNIDEGRALVLTNTTTFVRRNIDSFVNALRFSGLFSVDAFLERRPEFMDIGKAMMGIELLHDEVHEKLWSGDNNWLTYLYGHMIGGSLEEFASNRVAFVTFNYDRCIEHFFFTSLKNSFGKSDEETAEVAKKVQVLHLHGRLGFLPWQDSKSPIEFGDNQIDIRKMKVATDAIKVIHEDHTLDGRHADFDLAHVMMVNAQKVYLLGFGFGSRNVQRIKLDVLTPRVFDGTAYGLTDRELKDCKTLCGGRVNLYGYQCLDFMRQFVDFS